MVGRAETFRDVAFHFVCVRVCVRTRVFVRFVRMLVYYFGFKPRSINSCSSCSTNRRFDRRSLRRRQLYGSQQMVSIESFVESTEQSASIRIRWVSINLSVLKRLARRSHRKGTVPSQWSMIKSLFHRFRINPAQETRCLPVRILES